MATLPLPAPKAHGRVDAVSSHSNLLFLGLFLIPVVAVVLRGMLARVVNDRHHCEGNLFLASVWGAIWATVYTGPLALVVWGVHVWIKRAMAG